MVTVSPPVSPSVVAAILMIQKTSVTSGTLLITADPRCTLLGRFGITSLRLPDIGQRRAQHADAGARLHSLRRQIVAEGPPPVKAVKESETMARHRFERHALLQLRFDVRDEGFDRRVAACDMRRLAKEGAIDIEKQRRILIGGAPDHDAIDMRKLGLHRRDVGEPAVEHDW